MSAIKLIPSSGGSVSLVPPSATSPSGADVNITLPTTSRGLGKILQVVSATKTDTFSYTGSTAFANITGLSVNITPSSTSSKILVMLYLVASQANVPCTRIVRDSTPIGVGDAAGNRTRCTAQISNDNSYLSDNGTPIFLDSPGTTNQITYKAQISLEGSGHTVYVNRSVNDANDISGHRTISSITVMEVAA